jgi:hypothetical protein
MVLYHTAVRHRSLASWCSNKQIGRKTQRGGNLVRETGTRPMMMKTASGWLGPGARCLLSNTEIVRLHFFFAATYRNATGGTETRETASRTAALVVSEHENEWSVRHGGDFFSLRPQFSPISPAPPRLWPSEFLIRPRPDGLGNHGM